MDIEARKISIIQHILNIDNEFFVKELETKLAQLLPAYQSVLEEQKKIAKKAVAAKNIKVLSEEESTLLLKINEGLPADIQNRYHDLSIKNVQETLTEAEHQELLKLIPQVEAKNIERLKYLIALAQLWKMSVDDVMKKLEIQTPPVIHV